MPTDAWFQSSIGDTVDEAWLTVGPDSDGEMELPYTEYWEFKAYLHLLRVVSCVIIIFGTIGNLLTLIVLQGPHYNKSPSTVVFSVLAVSDLGYVLCGLGRQWIIGLSNFQLDIRNINQVSCRLQTGLTFFFKHSSAGLLAFLTIERTVSVMYPLRCKEWITNRRVNMCLIFILTILVVSTGVQLKDVHLDRTNRVPCDTHGEENLWFRDTVSYWIDALLSNIIPFSIIALGNCILVTKLYVARRKRTSEMQVQAADKTSSATAMLIAAGIAFLVTTTPKAIYYFGISYGWWPSESNQEWARIYLAYIITTLLVFLNSAINFVLYCATGTKFKRAFLATCRRNEKKLSYSSKITKQTVSNVVRGTVSVKQQQQK